MALRIKRISLQKRSVTGSRWRVASDRLDLVWLASASDDSGQEERLCDQMSGRGQDSVLGELAQHVELIPH
jgi:hypothetical protein